MEIKIFYSWQSDKSIPNRVNRTLIEDSLKKAVKNIRDDDSIEVEPVIDRDTLGYTGTPNIPQTILQKIDECNIFVCDITIINAGSKFRLTPNPNVLFELGYALRKLGWERVVMVMNEAYGSIDKLPFDLEKRRTTIYNLSKDSEEKANQRNLLTSKLESALRAIILENESNETTGTNQAESILNQTINAIENNEPKQKLLVKRYMEWLVMELDKINEEYISSENPEEAITEAINNSEWLTINFAKIAETVAVMKVSDTAHAIYKDFSKILDRYNIRPSQNLVHFKDTDFDFYKFIGHELFVVFISFFLREGHWQLIKELLKEEFYIQNISNSERRFVPIGFIPQSLKTFYNKKRRLNLRRYSLHADELAKRYREGEIGKLISFSQFMETDLFLFLYSEFNNPKNTFYYWWLPHSNVYYHHQTPKFLNESVKLVKSIEIGQCLGVHSTEEYRDKLRNAIKELKATYSNSSETAPLTFFNVDSIGGL